MKLVRFFSCLASVALLAGTASAAVLTDLSSFSETGNMLNSASHNREADFAVSGSSVTVTDPAGDGLPTNGSANQEMFLSNNFAQFNTPGLRFQLNFDTNFATSWTNNGGSSERFGLAVASAAPVGGPASSDVRSTAGGIFVWGIRSGNAIAPYLYSGSGSEPSVGDAGTLSGSDLGLYMEYTSDSGGGWNLGKIDSGGNDVFLQFRNTVSGVPIDADGTYIGLYTDMRNEDTVALVGSLEYGFNVPEPTSLALLMGGLGFIALGRRR